MNYKIKSLTFGILCMIFLCSCSSKAQPLPEHSLNNPTIQPQVVHLDIEEELKHHLINSTVFNEARERNAIILLDNQVITDGESSKQIIAEFLDREYAIFCIYNFYTDDNLPFAAMCNIYRKEQDKLRIGWTLCQDWEYTGEFKDYERVDSLEINEYGYLVANREPDVPLCHQIINDAELYENAAELTKLCKKYVSPVSVELSDGLCFSNASEIGEFWTWLFETFYRNQHPNMNLSDKYDGGLIPLEDVHLYLSRYFDVTIDELHEYLSNMPKFWSNYYISPNKILFYGGGRGGVYPKPRVTDYYWEGDVLNLTVDLYFFDGVPTHSDIMVKVQPSKDGSFQYLSIMPQEKIDYYNSFTSKELSVVKNAEYCFNRASDIIEFYSDAFIWSEDSTPVIMGNHHYYPCAIFSCMEELKTYTESVFSKSFCENALYHDPEQPPRFTEIDGRLYVSENGCTFSLNAYLKDNSIKVLSLDDKKSIISAEFSLHGGDSKTEEFKLVYENNRWVLDTYHHYNKK